MEESVTVHNLGSPKEFEPLGFDHPWTPGMPRDAKASEVHLSHFHATWRTKDGWSKRFLT